MASSTSRDSARRKPERRAAAPVKKRPSETRSEAEHRRAKVEEEPLAVMGGRFMIAALMVAAMVLLPPLGRAFEAKGPAPNDVAAWAPGAVSDVRITLITADYNKLGCAADKEFEGTHCAFKSETEVWPRDPTAPLDDNKKNIIQPYRTWPDNKLILVAGLWADPVVAMRLHREPPYAVAEKKLSRFVVDCHMRFLGRLESAKLRWGPGAPWQNEGAAMVARPESCKLKQE